MPNDLQMARYDGLVRRVGGLLGGGSKVTETLSEVFPVLDLENVPLELELLSGWRNFFTTQSPGPIVGETSRTSLFNPADSGRLIVLTDVWLRLNSTALVAYDTIDTPFASAQFAGFPRDNRDPGNSAGRVSELETGNTIRRGSLMLVVNTPFQLTNQKGLFVFAPGGGIDFGSVSDNVILDTTFFWKERDALPSELNFP